MLHDYSVTKYYTYNTQIHDHPVTKYYTSNTQIHDHPVTKSLGNFVFDPGISEWGDPAWSDSCYHFGGANEGGQTQSYHVCLVSSTTCFCVVFLVYTLCVLYPVLRVFVLCFWFIRCVSSIQYYVFLCCVFSLYVVCLVSSIACFCVVFPVYTLCVLYPVLRVSVLCFWFIRCVSCIQYYVFLCCVFGLYVV